MANKLVFVVATVMCMAYAVHAKGLAGSLEKLKPATRSGSGIFYATAKTCCPSLPDILNGTWARCNTTGNTHETVCRTECAFEKLGLLSDDKRSVNLPKLNAHLDTYATGEWAQPIQEAKQNCTSAAPAIESKKCSTGATEIGRCLIKYLTKKCPTPISEECKKSIEEPKFGLRKLFKLPNNKKP